MTRTIPAILRLKVLRFGAGKILITQFSDRLTLIRTFSINRKRASIKTETIPQIKTLRNASSRLPISPATSIFFYRQRTRQCFNDFSEKAASPFFARTNGFQLSVVNLKNSDAVKRLIFETITKVNSDNSEEKNHFDFLFHRNIRAAAPLHQVEFRKTT